MEHQKFERKNEEQGQKRIGDVEMLWKVINAEKKRRKRRVSYVEMEGRTRSSQFCEQIKATKSIAIIVKKEGKGIPTTLSSFSYSYYRFSIVYYSIETWVFHSIFFSFSNYSVNMV